MSSCLEIEVVDVVLRNRWIHSSTICQCDRSPRTKVRQCSWTYQMQN